MALMIPVELSVRKPYGRYVEHGEGRLEYSPDRPLILTLRVLRQPPLQLEIPLDTFKGRAPREGVRVQRRARRPLWSSKITIAVGEKVAVQMRRRQLRWMLKEIKKTSKTGEEVLQAQLETEIEKILGNNSSDKGVEQQ